MTMPSTSPIGARPRDTSDPGNEHGAELYEQRSSHGQVQVPVRGQLFLTENAVRLRAATDRVQQLAGGEAVEGQGAGLGSRPYLNMP